MKERRVIGKKLGYDYRKLNRFQGNAFNKAIYVEVKDEVYRLVKERAKERNISMRLWITRVIIKGLKDELRY